MTNRKTDLNIQVSAANQDVEISINEKDRLKTKRVNLLQADNTVYLVIEGEGCVFAQVSVIFADVLFCFCFVEYLYVHVERKQ